MKKLFPQGALAAAGAAGFAALAFSGAAHGQSLLMDTHLYVGAGVGHTIAGANVGDYSDVRTGAMTVVGSDSSTAWKAYAGLQFTPNWGAELSYAQLGEYNVNYSLGGSNGMGTNKLTAISLVGVGTLPLNDALSLHAMAGVAFVRSTYSFAGDGVNYPLTDSGNSNAVNATLGGGASYRFYKGLSVRFDYQSFGNVGQTTNNFTSRGATGKARPALASLGLEAKF